MEFLDFNSTKARVFLLHAIHSPFYWRILKETILFSGYAWANEGRKSGKRLSLISLCLETSTKIAVQEFHLWIRRFYHIAMHSSKGPRAKIICRTHIMGLPTLVAPLFRNIEIIF
jgi:hypothetical protein